MGAEQSHPAPSGRIAISLPEAFRPLLEPQQPVRELKFSPQNGEAFPSRARRSRRRWDRKRKRGEESKAPSGSEYPKHDTKRQRVDESDMRVETPRIDRTSSTFSHDTQHELFDSFNVPSVATEAIPSPPRRPKQRRKKNIDFEEPELPGIHVEPAVEAGKVSESENDTPLVEHETAIDLVLDSIKHSVESEDNAIMASSSGLRTPADSEVFSPLLPPFLAASTQQGEPIPKETSPIPDTLTDYAAPTLQHLDLSQELGQNKVFGQESDSPNASTNAGCVPDEVIIHDSITEELQAAPLGVQQSPVNGDDLDIEAVDGVDIEFTLVKSPSLVETEDIRIGAVQGKRLGPFYEEDSEEEDIGYSKPSPSLPALRPSEASPFEIEAIDRGLSWRLNPGVESVYDIDNITDDPDPVNHSYEQHQPPERIAKPSPSSTKKLKTPMRTYGKRTAARTRARKSLLDTEALVPGLDDRKSSPNTVEPVQPAVSDQMGDLLGLDSAPLELTGEHGPQPIDLDAPAPAPEDLAQEEEVELVNEIPSAGVARIEVLIYSSPVAVRNPSSVFPVTPKPAPSIVDIETDLTASSYILPRTGTVSRDMTSVLRDASSVSRDMNSGDIGPIQSGASPFLTTTPTVTKTADNGKQTASIIKAPNTHLVPTIFSAMNDAPQSNWSDAEELELVRRVQELSHADPDCQPLGEALWAKVSAHIWLRLHVWRSPDDCHSRWSALDLRLPTDYVFQCSESSAVSWRLEKARLRLREMSNATKISLAVSIAAFEEHPEDPHNARAVSDVDPAVLAALWHRLLTVIPKHKRKGVGGCAHYLVGKYWRDGSFREPSDADVNDIQEQAFVSHVLRQMSSSPLSSNHPAVGQPDVTRRQPQGGEEMELAPSKRPSGASPLIIVASRKMLRAASVDRVLLPGGGRADHTKEWADFTDAKGTDRRRPQSRSGPSNGTIVELSESDEATSGSDVAIDGAAIRMLKARTLDDMTDRRHVYETMLEESNQRHAHDKDDSALPANDLEQIPHEDFGPDWNHTHGRQGDLAVEPSQAITVTAIIDQVAVNGNSELPESEIESDDIEDMVRQQIILESQEDHRLPPDEPTAIPNAFTDVAIPVVPQLDSAVFALPHNAFSDSKTTDPDSFADARSTMSDMDDIPARDSPLSHVERRIATGGRGRSVAAAASRAALRRAMDIKSQTPAKTVAASVFKTRSGRKARDILLLEEQWKDIPEDY